MRRRSDPAEITARIIRHGLSTLLTRGDAAALVASRLTDPGCRPKTLRTRVAMRMERSVGPREDVKIGKIPREPDGRFLAGDVIRWARGNPYNLVFPKLPSTDLPIVDLVADGGFATGSILADRLPTTVDAAHARIRQLDQRIQELTTAAATWDADRRAAIARRFRKRQP